MDLPDQNGFVVWFTGLSGAGKTTLARVLRSRLERQGLNVYLLDGDVLRTGLNSDLGFSPADRSENIRRAAEVARLLAEEGYCVLATFISPYRADRQKARQIVGPHRFKEVYISCPLGICESRDVKGLYQKARAGLIPDFTGIHSPYEAPDQPEVVIATDQLSVEEAIDKLQQELFESNR